MEVIGSINAIGEQDPHLLIVNHKKEVLETKEFPHLSFSDALMEAIEWLKRNEAIYPLIAIGFRLVMGGPAHYKAEIITEEVVKDLKQFAFLAPNHLPIELNAIEAFKDAFPQVKQVACYDTSFHRNMPSYSKYYPLPTKYRNQGLIHYGFHGLSYESIMKKLSLRKLTGFDKKIIIVHLGNGSSMVAVKNDKSVDTSMGVSPLGGLVMGSRPGDLDPGIILFILKQSHLRVDELDDLLSKECGLKAISGSSDVQKLLKKENDDPLAKEAITVFCYHVKKNIGAYAAALGGLDILVFTGGIGENSALIRERICTDMEFLGIELNQDENANHREVISIENSKVMVLALKTNEELIIAEHTCALVNIKI